MKIVTLWQPWAGAIPFGWKRNETRTWPTKYRGAIAIHAGLAGNPAGAQSLAVDVNSRAGLPELTQGRRASDWVFGKIIAVAEVVDCVRAERIRSSLSRLEIAWGGYEDGRFVWILEEIFTIDPVPYTGAQGLRELDPEVESTIIKRNPVTRFIPQPR